MSRAEPLLLVVAASRMTGVRCYIDVDPDELIRALAPLAPIEVLGPPGQQVCCELWRVTDGRVLLGGLEQQEWVRVAHELGRAAGSFWGASASWVWGALAGAVAGPRGPSPLVPAALIQRGSASVREGLQSARRGALEGAARGGDLMARGAMNLTQWTLIEPYHELLLSIPDAVYPGCPEPVSVALGMATDLPLAFRLDRLAFYGFDKRMAAFSTDGRHRWEVTIDGAPLLSARFEPTGRDESDFDRATAASGTIQPLLGGLRDRRPMLSDLRRDLCASGEEVHEVEGTMEFAQELFPLMAVGQHRVRSREAPANRISLAFRDLDTYVTYPRSPS